MKFIPLILLSLLTILSCSDPTATQTKIASLSNSALTAKQLRHVVLFKFKETATPDDIKKIEDAFAALTDKIPEIKAFEWGTNNSPEGLDKGFTHCFFLTFENEAGRATYLPHPEHKLFGDIVGPHLEDVLVIDYWDK